MSLVTAMIFLQWQFEKSAVKKSRPIAYSSVASVRTAWSLLLVHAVWRHHVIGSIALLNFKFSGGLIRINENTCKHHFNKTFDCFYSYSPYFNQYLILTVYSDLEKILALATHIRVHSNKFKLIESCHIVCTVINNFFNICACRQSQAVCDANQPALQELYIKFSLRFQEKHILLNFVFLYIIQAQLTLQTDEWEGWHQQLFNNHINVVILQCSSNSDPPCTVERDN